MISTGNLDIEAMRFAAAHATVLLKTLANPDRLLLLCQPEYSTLPRRPGSGADLGMEEIN